MKKMMLAVLLASSIGAAACDVSPTDAGNPKPQYDGRTRAKTTQTTTDTQGQPGIGDPCDPATYDGPYNCVADPNSVSGYIVAT